MRKIDSLVAAAGSALARRGARRSAILSAARLRAAAYGYGNDDCGQVRAPAGAGRLRASVRSAASTAATSFATTGPTASRSEARNVERQLHCAARNGLNPYEANAINGRIARLEQQVQYSRGPRTAITAARL